MKKKQGDLAIIIVSWNTRELLKKCLESIYKQEQSLSYQVVVVDNNSSDSSSQMVEELFPKAILIKNKENRGFSKANNQGIKALDSRYFFLLNPDTLVHPQSLKRLVSFLETHDEVCAAGPKLLNPDGTIQREGFYRKFPSLVQVALFYTPLRRLSIRMGWLVRKYWEDFDESKTSSVDQIPGAALCIRKESLEKVGLLEEKFLIWFEDVDWCYRAKKARCELMFVPESTITHYGGQSFKQWSEKGKMLQLFSSLYLFFRLHRGRIAAETARVIILLASFTSITINFLRKYFRAPGFKSEDYEARKWFVARFVKLELSERLPKL